MKFENLLIDLKNAVCTITINRADKLNALNKRTIEEIGLAIKQAESDDIVRVVIVTGAGSKAFIAGADISEFADFNLEEGKKLAEHGHRVFKSIENCRKP